MTSFEEEAARLGFDLDAVQLRRFAAYRDLIVEAAGRFNLTAVRRPAEVERRHFLESLTLGRALVDLGALPAEGDCKALDLGSGAGIPGLPLKIAWPKLRLALLEAQAKRCQFLREAVEALGLEDVVALEGRAEVWGRHQEHREKYDLVLARAVAPLPVLLEYALPFVRVGGCLAAPKGSAAARELALAGPALRALGGEIEARSELAPPGGLKQTLVLVRKTMRTPERYPRRSGIVRKRPLA